MKKTKEILKTIAIILLFWNIIIYGIINLPLIDKTSISLVILEILFVIIYLFSLINDLEQIENEYANDINEHTKKHIKRLDETQKDLEERGLTFSGEAIKKLGKKSAFTPEKFGHPIPKGELEVDKEDYEKYRVKKFKLDFQKAKYKVITNLLKK